MRKTRLIGLILVFFAVFIFSYGFSLSGAVIGLSSKINFFNFVSIAFFITGVFLILIKGIENRIVESRVKQDSLLLKVAENVGAKDSISRDINHLLSELNKGHINPGLGTKAIHGASGIHELRGRNGGRVYFRKISRERYEILGYSDKSNQEKVINRLRELYH